VVESSSQFFALEVLLLFDFGSRVVSSLSNSETRDVASLIESQGLVFEEGADHTAVVEDSEGRLAATASLFGSVVRMVAVAPEHQESGLSSIAISSLIEAARVEGKSHLFVYTKPEMAGRFASLGFRNIAETDAVALLEIGEPGIGMYRKYLARNRLDLGPGKKYGAAVVNCDPFTLGHRYLIERAVEMCDLLYIIVVEAELSSFSFEDRLTMTRAGTRDLEAQARVRVIGSGEYAVSSATFPSYFLKERAQLDIALQQTRLDVELFTRLYVPALEVSVRFVGSEPSSPVTAVYNRAMREELPKSGVDVVEIERAKTVTGEIISASAARKILGSGDVKDIRRFLPDSTIEYIGEKFSRKL
jgi:[citrate (pro-3S)-lyase] ligase